MSNETSRAEAAARAAHKHDFGHSPSCKWEDSLGALRADYLKSATAALAAADADDHANGIRRVRVDEATVEKAAKAVHDMGAGLSWADRSEAVRELYREDVRAVLAAATDGADR